MHECVYECVYVSVWGGIEPGASRCFTTELPPSPKMLVLSHFQREGSDFVLPLTPHYHKKREPSSKTWKKIIGESIVSTVS